MIKNFYLIDVVFVFLLGPLALIVGIAAWSFLAFMVLHLIGLFFGFETPNPFDAFSHKEVVCVNP